MQYLAFHFLELGVKKSCKRLAYASENKFLKM